MPSFLGIENRQVVDPLLALEAVGHPESLVTVWNVQAKLNLNEKVSRFMAFRDNRSDS